MKKKNLINQTSDKSTPSNLSNCIYGYNTRTHLFEGYNTICYILITLNCWIAIYPLHSVICLEHLAQVVQSWVKITQG